ncbi:hypothetical protein MNV49_007968 [Pseudohyphozyma bogoriensis]|nr:hypothetical protein MNV49_007968 [Pseudohyphozyma bogoriensis]
MGIMDVWRPVRVFIWGEYKATHAEEVLLRKIDFGVLVFACLMYFIGRLDNNNLANAYVSGMKEALGMSTADYSKITSLYQAGYAVGQIPTSMCLLYFKPRYQLCVLTFFLGLFSLIMSFAKTTATVMGLRFLVGFCESGIFCSVMYILGSWYKPGELARRSAIFVSSGYIGAIISGSIQTGINTSLAGRLGRPGWRWLFIINACMTFPIAIYGFFMFADTPSTTTAWYMTKAERKLAIDRLPPRDKAEWNKASFKLIITSWQSWLWPILFTTTGLMELFNFNNFAPVWMKQYPHHYSVSDQNLLVNWSWFVAIMSIMIVCSISDNTRLRWPCTYVMAVGCIIFSVIFLVYPSKNGEPDYATMQAGIYIQAVVFAGQACNYSWANECTRHNAVLRAFTLATMNLLAYIFIIWQVFSYPVYFQRRDKGLREAEEAEAAVEQAFMTGATTYGGDVEKHAESESSIKDGAVADVVQARV